MMKQYVILATIMTSLTGYCQAGICKDVLGEPHPFWNRKFYLNLVLKIYSHCSGCSEIF